MDMNNLQRPIGDDIGVHLAPSIRDLLSTSPAARIRKIHAGVTILYPILECLLNEIRWLIKEPRGSRARGILISGANGSGKTSIIEMLGKEFPMGPLALNRGEQFRVIAISMSGVRTTKAALNRILDVARVPIARSRTVSDHERVVADTLRALNCSLLITDETQDILSGSQAEQIRVIEVLKNLMNEIRLPMLSLGTEAGKDAFRADPHMAARFESYNLPNWVVGDDLGDFLTAYEQYLPLKYRSDLARPEIQKILLKKSGGVLDPMLQCLRRAAMHAVVDGTERITLAALEADLPRPSVAVLTEPKHGAP